MQHKKTFAGIVAGLLAVVVAIALFVSVERVPVGYVGVVYSAAGVEDQTLAQGWHLLSPLKKVSKFPVSQQQIVFSDDPADYGEKEHADWSIDAPADGGMVKINLTVNYNFMPDRVVELYSRFNGMNGETLVESRIQNSIIAFVKEVTPRFSVMDIYSDKKSEVNEAITEYLNEKLQDEYGINIASALVIDVELDNTLMQKVQAKEQAKQDAEIAELEKQTAMAQAEIKFDKTTANLGTFPEEKPVVSCVFTFTNIGDAPLVIHQAVASCGCTVPEYTQEPVLPGKKGTIKVTYNGTGKYPGHFKKSITLRTNAKTEMMRLFIEGDMTPKGEK